jgi:hypothetical protein
MATTVREILGSAYALLNNASEEELDLAVALTQYGITVSEMRHEKISGYRNPEIRKALISFAEEDSEQDGTLSEFEGDVVLLRFNGTPIPQVPFNMLDEYRLMDQQAAAFYTDVSGVSQTINLVDDEGNIQYVQSAPPAPQKKIQLARALPGDLEIWYEPRATVEINQEGNADIEDAYKYLLVTRLAYNCSKYVLYNDPRKEQNKQIMIPALMQQAAYAKDLYMATVNKTVDTSRPYPRLPYSAR